MWSRGLVLALLVALVALPFALRRRAPTAARSDEVLVIITPHNEAIRHEFGAAFQRWYRERTGRTVFVDWRVIGGTSEIVRYLRSEYLTSFENHWRRDLGREWGNAVAAACMNDRVVPDATPADDTPPEAARRAFLSSKVGVGIDLFFGGGSYDFDREARAGRLVDSGMIGAHPEWFNDAVIPRRFAGEPYWDPEGRWIGCVLSSYGMLYNRDALARLGVAEPRAWKDATNPRLEGEVALADPTKSASIAKAFEMVIQQQMHRRLGELAATEPDPARREARAVREGWMEGLRLLQLAGANARYFTDSSQKPPIDVSQGDSALGMCIDFYGRYQEETMGRREGGARLKYITPAGGSVYSVDPIALFRGAAHPETARAFIEFVLSMEGQKVWGFRLGAPGGPQRFALRRLPVRRDFYADASFVPHRSDPDVQPFNEPDPITYRQEWTGPLFKEMAFIIRVMAIDSHLELRAAWHEIIAAGRAPKALERLTDLSAVDYDRALGEIKQRLNSRNKIDEMQLARELGRTFRANYRQAAEFARDRR